MEVIALLVDLGHPERIWHYLFIQNVTSFLLFIGLYVMIYQQSCCRICASQCLSDSIGKSLHNLDKRFMKPFVIIGAYISVLHQGSLGSLLLIQPVKFFRFGGRRSCRCCSSSLAVAIAIAMTIFESSLSSRYFHRGRRDTSFRKTCRAIPLRFRFVFDRSLYSTGFSW